MSVAVDFDVLALAFLNADKHDALREFKNPRNIFRRFERFMDALYETGLLKTAMATHTIISITLLAGFYFYGGDLFVPALLGVLTHIASDIPNIKRAFS